MSNSAGDVIPRSVVEEFIEEKKEYADFLETTSAPDGVASEVRDCAVELEQKINRAEGGDGPACPACDEGILEVSDAIYADCNNCTNAVPREEVGL